MELCEHLKLVKKKHLPVLLEAKLTDYLGLDEYLCRQDPASNVTQISKGFVPSFFCHFNIMPLSCERQLEPWCCHMLAILKLCCERAKVPTKSLTY